MTLSRKLRTGQVSYETFYGCEGRRLEAELEVQRLRLIVENQIEALRIAGYKASAKNLECELSGAYRGSKETR